MLINYAVETSLFLHVLEQLTTLGGNEDISPHYSRVKPGFHIVVSVVSVVRKKIIGQIEFILFIIWKPRVQMLNTKETTDTTCCTK